MVLDASQLSATTRLFSSGVFRELAKKGRSPLFARLIRQSPVLNQCVLSAKVRDAFESAFAILRTVGLRDEYVYRTALTQKVLMGTHSLRTASMLSEFRVGDSKADLVILNGTATVYEIKSERDCLSRLEKQIANYRKVFAKVYVIAGENHAHAVLNSAPSDVGVLCLSRRYQISTLREAEDLPGRVCTVTVFESLRSVEACLVLKELGVPVPKVPNTALHAELRECFRRLEPVDVHRAMVRTLKRTRDLAPLAQLVDQLPPSLHAAALSIPLRQSDHKRLLEATEMPLEAALNWLNK